MSQTITRSEGRPRSRPQPRSYLVLALEHDRPSAGAARYHLEDVDVVQLSRGKARLASRTEPRTLQIAVPDGRVSQPHAQLRRELDRFVIEDLGSKNGVTINGQRLGRALLNDGDRVEIGHTLFLFRTITSSEPISDCEGVDAALPIGMTTLSPLFATELERLRLVASSSTSILVEGETGTGKELIARAVHAFSGRRGPFVAVNCGALPATLVESELFGHRRGAFSGAIEDRPGLIRSAEGGTLLLDEVGDLSDSAQVALLRVLQEKEVLTVGATKPVKVDVRVVAATHRDLPRMVERGQFRQDLLARLSGFSIHLPPLRERKEDLGLCMAALLTRFLGARAEQVRLTSKAAHALFGYDWPHNIRELEQYLSAALALAGDGPIELEHLPSLEGDPATRHGAAIESAERDRLIELMRNHAGNISAAARATGKARMQIQRWLRRYQIDPRGFRS